MQVNRRMGLVAKLASTLVVALAAAAAGSSWAQPTQLRPPASALGSAPKPIGMGTAAGNSMHNIPPAVLVPQAPQEKKTIPRPERARSMNSMRMRTKMTHSIQRINQRPVLLSPMNSKHDINISKRGSTVMSCM